MKRDKNRFWRAKLYLTIVILLVTAVAGDHGLAQLVVAKLMLHLVTGFLG
jgi:hypothetical protein